MESPYFLSGKKRYFSQRFGVGKIDLDAFDTRIRQALGPATRADHPVSTGEQLASQRYANVATTNNQCRCLHLYRVPLI